MNYARERANTLRSVGEVEKPPSNRWIYWLLLSMIGVGAWAALLGCPPGTKTSAEFTVNVDVSSCKEDRNAPQTPDMAVLDCAAVNGGGNVRVVFPRQDWWTMKLRQVGVIDAGPGK